MHSGKIFLPANSTKFADLRLYSGTVFESMGNRHYQFSLEWWPSFWHVHHVAVHRCIPDYITLSSRSQFLKWKQHKVHKYFQEARKNSYNSSHAKYKKNNPYSWLISVLTGLNLDILTNKNECFSINWLESLFILLKQVSVQTNVKKKILQRH